MLIVDAPRRSEVADVVQLATRNLTPDVDADSLVQAAFTGGCMVARDTQTDTIVGFALARREPCCDAHLIALAVDADHRGSGVGKALLRTVQENMLRTGAMRMTLEVRSDNVAAQHFYARQGFAPEGLQTQAYPDGADAVRLTRPL